ncbi:MAG: mechanosensitive ion channel [Clostridia bacterium]|nr:mechanosensitive ion channel [Clostridia bacterium]
MPIFLSAEVKSGVSEVLTAIRDFCVSYGFKLIGAILVLIIGCWLVKLAIKLMTRSRWYGRIDKDVQGFAKSALKGLLYAIVVITAVAIMGVPMASVVAVIASCGVAIGLALQGSLSNLAGGLMLVIFKPFHVGDFISANGYDGTVEEIGLFCTTLNTLDNRRVVLPNAGLSNSCMVNATHFDTRRVDRIFPVDPSADSERIIGILKAVADAQEMRLPDRETEVRLDSFGDGCAKYHVRIWCNTPDYWSIYYSVLEDGKRALAENGIDTALPSMEIRNR